MAMGGSGWIAGVQYLHSLLYGNSLLSVKEQALLRLYLDSHHHRFSDYQAMRPFAAGIDITDYSSTPLVGFYRTLRRVAGVIVRQGRLPARPLDLSGLLRKHEIDVLFAGTHVDPRLVIPQVCWIPDFQHVHRPDFFSTEERQARDEHFARIMEQADRVIVSNQCSYSDAAQLYPKMQSKLAVLPFTMYLGNNWRTTGGPAKQLRKYGLPAKFLLFPGQLWKHKNHATLFQAISILRKRGFDDLVLVCTGLPYDVRFPEHAAELAAFLVEHKLERAVRILGLLPRNDEVQLMRAAAGIVQPSLFEGWSAVVEEARSLGRVVFASDIPMHREQLTPEVHLFAAKSPDALADLLEKFWPDLGVGPNPDREAKAYEQYQIRIREFARGLVAICRDVVASRGR